MTLMKVVYTVEAKTNTMEEKEFITFRLVRTKTVDKLLKDNGKWVAANEGSNMTDNEIEEMKLRGEALEEELEEIQSIQSELLEKIEEAGFDIEEIISKI